MAVRPPQQQSEDAPDTVAFGIAAIDGYLNETDMQFPASSDEILDTVGDRDVPYNVAGNTVKLSTVLEAVNKSAFDDRQELMNEMHPVFEYHREQAKSSIFTRIRALLPF